MKIGYTCSLSATKISKLTEINLSYFSCVVFDNYGDVRVTNSFYKIEKKGEKGIGETVEKRMWRVAFKQLSHETALSSSDLSYFTDSLDSLFLPWLFSPVLDDITGNFLANNFNKAERPENSATVAKFAEAGRGKPINLALALSHMLSPSEKTFYFRAIARTDTLR